MSDRILNIGVVQHACREVRADNLDASINGIREAVGRGASLVLLQELHTLPYFCQSEDTHRFDQAETIPGPTTKQLSTLAAELKVVIVASLFERRSAGIYHNTAVVIDNDGSIAGKYRKMHIPDDPRYYEKFYFTPGDLGFSPIDSAVGRLGVLVCWDQWYPEAARLMALAGAEVLLFPTAIGWDPRDDSGERQRQRDAWLTVQRGHAIANGLPVVCTNRIGHEPDPSGAGAGIDFWGSSFIAGPQGEILVAADSGKAAACVASVDMNRSEQVRRLWPFLRDRRIDAYQELLKRYRD